MEALRFQRTAGATSPLLGAVLDATLADIEVGGPCAAVLEHVDPALEPVADAVTLRFLGAVHRVVLDGRAPALAAHYPSAGGSFDPDAPGDLAAAFVATVDEHRAELVDGLRRTVQTNEVGRSAALLPGFLTVAAASGLPLRVLEIGASAGLNLRWDHYRYEGGANGSTWGDAGALVRLTGVYSDPAPDLAVPATVVERKGCDASPIDAGTPDGRLALRAFVWPDQLERQAALAAALDVAAAVPVDLQQADAGEWAERELARPVLGTATVLVHSIVWQYLPVPTRRRILSALDAAGKKATPDAPIAWLRMEPGEDFAKSAEVRLTTWPGEERLLAKAGYHGKPVRMIS